MFKKRILFLLIIVAFCLAWYLPVNAEDSLQILKELDTYFPAKDGFGTKDGGYVFYGSISDYEEESIDIKKESAYVVKVDKNGEKLWDTGLIEQETKKRTEIFGVDETEDGGIVVAGVFYDEFMYNGWSYNGSYGFLSKYSKDGVFEWGYTIDDFEGCKELYVEKVVVTDKTRAFVYVRGIKNEKECVIYISVDLENGQVLWSKKSNEGDSDKHFFYTTNVEKTFDGQILISDSIIKVNNYGHENIYCEIEKIDMITGKVTKLYEGTQNNEDHIDKMIPLPDGGILIGMSRENVTLKRLRADGSLEFQDTMYEVPWQDVADLKVNKDGSFILFTQNVGFSYEESMADDFVCSNIVKFNQKCEHLWSIPLKDIEVDKMIITDENCLLISGHEITWEKEIQDGEELSYSVPNGVVITKVDSDGNLMWSEKVGDRSTYNDTVALLHGSAGEYWLLHNFGYDLKNIKDNTYSTADVIVNGKKVEFDEPPKIENGRTLLPVRKIFEVLGASVQWNEQEKKVTGKKDSKVVVLTIDSDVAYINGKAINLDVPAKTINGRTMVPARFISEALGADVNWNEANHEVIITVSN